jgi:hypothetical protein
MSANFSWPQNLDLRPQKSHVVAIRLFEALHEQRCGAREEKASQEEEACNRWRGGEEIRPADDSRR